ncbi:MAG: hypothetical protein WBM41_08640 [Arenicellales bacterium]
MLTKLLFTLIVIIGVAIFYRNKASRSALVDNKSSSVKTDGSIPTRSLAYILIGILVAISAGVFAYNWRQNNQIINIKVTSEVGGVVNYQARQGAIKGRKFTSIDGIKVTLGEGDRIEILSK